MQLNYRWKIKVYKQPERDANETYAKHIIDANKLKYATNEIRAQNTYNKTIVYKQHCTAAICPKISRRPRDWNLKWHILEHLLHNAGA